MNLPHITTAISCWLTDMAQRDTPSDIINKRMQCFYVAMNYIEEKNQFECELSDIVHAHFGQYDEMVVDLELNAEEISFMFKTINSFLLFVKREFDIPTCLLEIINENTGKNRKHTSMQHMKLISIIKRMSAKQKRGVVGVLLERHRELKEIDDIMRSAW